MAWEIWSTWPNEGKLDWRQQIVDTVAWPYKANITANFQDIHRMKFNAEEIKLSAGTRFDEAVDMLLQQKEKGKNCFINFSGVKIYSVDTDSVDDAYIQFDGMTKAELEEKARKEREGRDAFDRETKRREEWYAKQITESREWVEEVKITKENVVAGLKFIAEHQDMEQNQLIHELIKLGCNFTMDDINKQFPKKVELFLGMRDGNLWCGASVIVNVMTWEYWRWLAKSYFLSGDHDVSVYAFIRKVTGDQSYTKKYVDSLRKNGR